MCMVIKMSYDFGYANENQIKAIKTTEGPLLIIAGPGTGKTYTLINRVMYLILEKNVEPENIMLVTFTDKAAKEIITRLSNELIKYNIRFNVDEMYIGTFHSVCLKLLKEHIEYTNLKRNFRVYDQFDQQYFLFQNYWRTFNTIENINLVIEQKGSIWDRVAKLQKIINIISDELIDPISLSNSESEEAMVIAEIIYRYKSLREEHNFIDFSSIQTETYNMIINFENGVLDKLQEKIRYVMIDEYQDTNYIQEQLALLISSKNKNICVVGDDDQGLYRFRGATIRNILEFETHFDDCKKIVLNDNYRSEKDIINFYNNYMNSTSGRGFSFEWDKFRIQKKINYSKQKKNNFQSIGKIVSADRKTLNDDILSFIKRLKENKIISDYNQIAFLFRSVKNNKVLELANYLEENGISVYSPRSNLFFERTEIKLLFGVLLLMFPSIINLMKTNDKKWLTSLYNYYHNCIKDTIKELNKAENKNLSNFIKVRAKEHLLLPEENRGLDYSIAQLIYQLFQFELFSDIVTVDLRDGLKNTLRSRNIAIFIKHVAKFEFNNNLSILTSKNIEYMVNKLFTEFFLYLYQGGITEYEDESEYAPSGCVAFLTIHQSKGLEFPIVVVDSLYSIPRENLDELMINIIDNYSNREPFEPTKQLKYFDFWRLFYTAFSRAKELLILVGSKESRGISKYFEEHVNFIKEFNDYENLVVSKIKDSKLKKTYSFTTDIDLYEESPIEYLFFKELGYPRVSYGAAIFGSLVHATIEDIHKAVLRGEQYLINEEVINKWMMSNYDAISRAERNYLSPRFLEQANNQILSYFKKREYSWGSIKEVEVPISLVKENYVLSGRVDLLEGKDGKYEIIDFKTEKKPDLFKDKDKIDKTRKQLEIYAHILEERYGYEISKLKIYYTSEELSNPIIEFKKDKHSIQNTIKYFDHIVNKIENKEFSSKPEDNNIGQNSDIRYYLKML